MLVGKKCILRSLEMGDVDTLHRLMNNWTVRKYLATSQFLSREDVVTFVQYANEQKKKMAAFYYAIVDKESKELIGVVSLHKIDWKNRNAEFGITIWNPDYWDRGIGTDAARVFLHYAFSELNLHRIEGRLFEFNKRTIRLNEKLGFKLEGVLRDAFWRDGRWHNVLIMSVLANEFYEKNRDKIQELLLAQPTL